MATYVLVHGAWSGAHCFRHIRPLLREAGHDVYTPSLTGIGERAHLSSAWIDLTTHIRDVVNAILYEDLSDIILLGFSYGGFVVTGALAHIGERVRHLVYLDAFVPNHGDTVMAVCGLDAPPVITVGEPWLVPPVPREFDDPGEAAFMNARRTPHPVGCFTEPVCLSRPLEQFPFARSYIKATADAPDAPGAQAFWAAAQRAQASSAWNYLEIATNHMVASNRPSELAQALLALA